MVSLGKLMHGAEASEPEHLSDFGIRAINYKVEESVKTMDDSSSNLGTYFVTSDSFEDSQLWCPQLFATTRLPVAWSMSYLVPPDVQVVSSGQFRRQLDLVSPEGEP